VPVTGSARSGACAILALYLVGCTGPSDPTEQLAVQSSAHFELVSGVLGTGCGSLDCHGQVGRSLRIYSQAGLRLDPEAFPSLDGGTVSSVEIEANYQAVIALEPEVLALVLRDHGENPERLTLVRKGRGSESHKGGAAIAVGSTSDRCILSWLSSALDETACTDGAMIPQRPVTP
jgi:hypothetical protein